MKYIYSYFELTLNIIFTFIKYNGRVSIITIHNRIGNFHLFFRGTAEKTNGNNDEEKIILYQHNYRNLYKRNLFIHIIDSSYAMYIPETISICLKQQITNRGYLQSAVRFSVSLTKQLE